MGVKIGMGPNPAPNIPKSTIVYSEPQNNIIPVIKKEAASLTPLQGNEGKTIPVTSKAKL